MKLIVTGGAGFIGSNFIRYLLKQEYFEVSEIIVIDKLTYAGKRYNILNEKRISFIHSDICDVHNYEHALSDSDYFVNFAAETHVDRSIQSSEPFVYSNILGVQRILETIRLVNPGLRFLQVSTDEVYGSINFSSWSEENILEPNSPYSASKASSDLIVRAYHRTYQLNTVITRCSNNYGPAQDVEKFIPKVITNAIQNLKIPIYGDGQNIRDWLFVEDHCHAILKCLINGESGEIYNISGGHEMNNKSVVAAIQEIMNFDSSLVEFVPDRKGHDFRYSVSASKIEKKLGFFPNISFEHGLKMTIDWYLSNQNLWRATPR